MGQQVINIGSSPGDGTGESGYSGGAKINANFSELYALLGAAGGTGYITAVVTAASTNNYNPGGTFPSAIGRIDINPTTNNIALTGLVAGVDGQQVIIRNIGTTYQITLKNENSGSSNANRFTGEGDAAIPSGAQLQLFYYANPNPRWSIG